MMDSQTNLTTELLLQAGVDLHLDVRGPKLGASLTDALREAVRSGRLKPGARLPASRTLAADLGIARSTVTESYAELVAEGWLTAQQGSATRVAERSIVRRSAAAVHGVPVRRRAHGLLPGAADFAEFPRAQWLTASRRALSAAPPDAFGYGDPLGRMELRVALAEYLARVRGVYAEPERIIICAGFHHGLALMAQALIVRGVGAVAVESYGLDLYRHLLTHAGLGIPALSIDEHGAVVDELSELAGVGAVLLTPAHQFPTGVALSPERRAAVIDWSRTTGGLILEDDYDGEFRYDRKPVGALQGLDPDGVVYFGTASKSLAPALRVSWMVVPDNLLSDVAAAKGGVETVSVLEQLTLAEFITSGAFDRHVRSRRQSYRRRRDQLVQALAQSAPDIRVTGMAAGLQVVLELPAGTEAWVVQAASRQGLMVSGMAEFRHGGRHPHGPRRDALVVNYSAVSDSAWPGALKALCSVMP
ncbi:MULTISPECIES: MocR-like pyridoxine biosynthesis transcription factor PdxR [unclassified Streptomyces]|uniref:MocR-like pyridoxine biosynthesis transcription factor PdxR n=1 Tax=unclassified Streptomyces TaxID=2593676 RepID=UPI000879526C|nr:MULTISPECIES: PLP-dependent aminotransferase family protein [unclassified Streptomyces]REH18427.1 GntR family transcriptional regulator [Streptomyces sp. 2221.1]SDS24482.1 transcriptional regulator, GntR family [Streptomyces sp. 2114.2]